MSTVRLNDDQRKMVEDNMPLVFFFINKFCFIYSRARASEIEDLRQELFVGLCRAAYEYRPELGGFASYAIWWFRSFLVKWRRSLIPVGMRASIEGLDFPDRSNPSLDRWRELLESLSDKERIVFRELRIRERISKRTIGMSNYTYNKTLTNSILKLRREYTD